MYININLINSLLTNNIIQLYHVIFKYYISIIILFKDIIICSICKTLYLYVSSVYTVMWHAIIMPSYMSKYLIKDPLQKKLNTYSILYGQTNPLYTNQYKLSTINTQCTVCPATGWNNVLYDNNNHSNTKQNISLNSDDFANKQGTLNRTDQSSLNDIDPDLNYLGMDIRSINTQYFDDQTFRDKFKFNNTLSMCHLNIRSLPEHFIEFTAYIELLNIDFKIIFSY